MNLEGKWSLVTGAGHRVGKNIANKLSENGSNIFLHYGKSENAASEAASELRANGSEVVLIQADLTKETEIDKIFTQIDETSKRLDVTVNSAASFLKKKLVDTTVEHWDGVQNTNLRAPFLIAKRSADYMQKNEGKERGNIIFISDLSGVFVWKGYTIHGVSKAGIIHLTKSLAFELAPTIRVNGIIPGLILPPPGMSADDQKWIKRIENVPLKREGSPDYVSETVLFLLKNNYMTGNLMYVDGGEHLVGNLNHLE